MRICRRTARVTRLPSSACPGKVDTGFPKRTCTIKDSGVLPDSFKSGSAPAPLSQPRQFPAHAILGINCPQPAGASGFGSCHCRRDREETAMTSRFLSRCLGTAILALSAFGASADEIVRFAPLAPDQLSAEQRAYAEAITAPPRNARFTNPPYRAYIRNIELAQKLTPLSDY